MSNEVEYDDNGFATSVTRGARGARHCSPTELLGALLFDGIRPGVAESISAKYAEALRTLDEDEIEAWLEALRSKVPHGQTWLYTLAMGSGQPARDPAYIKGMATLAAKDAKARLARGEVV